MVVAEKAVEIMERVRQEREAMMRPFVEELKQAKWRWR